MRRAHHPSGWVRQFLPKGWRVGFAIGPIEVATIAQLFVTRRKPGLDHQQASNVAEVEDAIDRQFITKWLTDRHPLVIGLDSAGLAINPQPLIGLVIFCPVLKTIIGGFMIIPDHDPRGLGVGRLELRIGFVLSVAHPVVGQADNLTVGRVRPLAGHGGVHPVGLGSAILVDIVAQVQHGIDPFKCRNGPVGVEITSGIKRTRRDSQDHILGGFLG